MSHGSGPPVAEPTAPSGGTRRLVLRGDLDWDTSQEFLGQLQQALLELGPGGRIELDCAKLEFCDSIGLSALLMGRRSALAGGAILTMTDEGGYLGRLLHITGVAGLFGLHGAPPRPHAVPGDDGMSDAAG